MIAWTPFTMNNWTVKKLGNGNIDKTLYQKITFIRNCEWNTFAAIQKYHKAYIIKEYNFLRCDFFIIFYLDYYFIFDTRFSSLNVSILRGGKYMKNYHPFTIFKRHIFNNSVFQVLHGWKVNININQNLHCFFFKYVIQTLFYTDNAILSL